MQPISMDMIDRIVSKVSPAAGLSRMRDKFQMSAMSENGYITPGSRRKSMKGMTARPHSPGFDITRKLGGMRGLSRDLFMNAPLAVSILRRRKTHDIGSGLQYQSRVDAKFLGLTDEQRDEFQRTFEREFDLWADSPNSDFDEANCYGDNQALAYLNMLLSGDFFWMPVWRKPREKDFPYQLAIKLIDADLVRDPIESQYGFYNYKDRDIEGGVEHGSDGRILGYHVWNTYPGETTSSRGPGQAMFVPAFDSDGRRQMYHVFDPERIKQRRGVPLLASVAEPLKQMTRLAESELMNALVASFFTVFVKDQSGMNQYLAEARPPEEQVTGGGSRGPDDPEEFAKKQYDEHDLEMGYGNVTYLDDDKDITIAEPRKTDRDFGAFWEALGTQVAAGGGVPFERAQLKYTTSYTAARASTNDAWLGSLTSRTVVNRGLNHPVLGEFFNESLLRGRIAAPGYFDDYAYRKAWTRSQWVGFGQGFLDPLREAKADAIRLNNFTTTHEEIYTQKSGGRWDSSIERRSSEERLLEEHGLINQPDPTELVGPDGQKDKEDEDDDADTNS